MADYEVRENLLYTEDHEWISKDSDQEISIGITAYAAKQMDQLVYAEPLVFEDDEVSEGDVIATLESVKAASDVYSPVNGTVVDSNQDIEESPDAISENPYDVWLVKVSLDDVSQLDKYMDADAYEKFLAKEA